MTTPCGSNENLRQRFFREDQEGKSPIAFSYCSSRGSGLRPIKTAAINVFIDVIEENEENKCTLRAEVRMSGFPSPFMSMATIWIPTPELLLIRC